MRIAGTTTYGNSMNLLGADLHTTKMTAQRSGAQRPVPFAFSYDYRGR